MINQPKLEITSDFDKFKIGLVNRIIDNYENTYEREQAINKISDVRIVQAIKQNAFCKDILPILWDATPQQNEKDYCHTSQIVYVRIISGYNKELRVRSSVNICFTFAGRESSLVSVIVKSSFNGKQNLIFSLHLLTFKLLIINF
jgi:hypothetical protein